MQVFEIFGTLLDIHGIKLFKVGFGQGTYDGLGLVDSDKHIIFPFDSVLQCWNIIRQKIKGFDYLSNVGVYQRGDELVLGDPIPNAAYDTALIRWHIPKSLGFYSYASILRLFEDSYKDSRGITWSDNIFILNAQQEVYARALDDLGNTIWILIRWLGGGILKIYKGESLDSLEEVLLSDSQPTWM